MDRRDFLKACLAAAVAANVPGFTPDEAWAAYDAICERGIEEYGNGWYRVWMTTGGKRFSVFAKAGDSSHVALQHGRVRAYFDLGTGKVGDVSVVEDEYGCVNFGPVSFHANDATIYRPQLELVA